MASVLVAGETPRKKKPEKMLEMVSFKHHAGRGGDHKSHPKYREKEMYLQWAVMPINVVR